MLDAPEELSAETLAAHRKLVMRSFDELRLLRITPAGGEPRSVQPHAILRKPDGSEHLQVYQLPGESERRSDYGWRHFDLATLTSVDLLSVKFTPRRDFRPVSGDSGVVVAQVRGSVPAGM